MSSPVLRLRGGGGKVEHVGNTNQLQALMAANAGKLIVIDFTATWCGPCQRVAPIFVQMSEKYGDVVFVKVDVDDAAEVAEAYGVNCMPTFIFLKNGSVVHKIEGADLNALTKTIEEKK
jgi:thioredoxin 1